MCFLCIILILLNTKDSNERNVSCASEARNELKFYAKRAQGKRPYG
jgi:hypothetical protein